MFQQVTTKSQEMRSKEDFVQHYKAVRARLTGSPPKEEPKIKMIPVILESNIEKVQAARVMGPRTKGNLIINRILFDNQISREEVFSLSRKHKLIFIRAQIWAELHKIGMSLTQIGRFCRPEHPYDHTTILNGVRKFPKYVQQAKERELVHVA